jgi:hypothetical protein
MSLIGAALSVLVSVIILCLCYANVMHASLSRLEVWGVSPIAIVGTYAAVVEIAYSYVRL